MSWTERHTDIIVHGLVNVNKPLWHELAHTADLFIYVFKLLKANSPVDRTGSPQGISHGLTECSFLCLFQFTKRVRFSTATYATLPLEADPLLQANGRKWYKSAAFPGHFPTNIQYVGFCASMMKTGPFREIESRWYLWPSWLTGR